MIYRLFGHSDTLMSDRQLTSWTKCYCVRGVCWVFTWIVSFVFNTKLAFLPRSPTMCSGVFRKWLETPFGSFQSCSYTLSEADLVFYFHSTSKVWFVRWQVLTLYCVIFHFILLTALVPRSAMLQLFCITLLWYCLSNCVLRALFSNSVLLYWPHYS